jgi:hypothetical protein
MWLQINFTHSFFFEGEGEGARGGAVVEALRYKPEGRGIDYHGVNGIFHWRNPSCRTMAQVSTQPLTEMSTRG